MYAAGTATSAVVTSFDTMSVSDFFNTASSVEAAAKEFLKKPAKVVRREESSTKLGRVSPPTVHPPPRSRNPIVRFFRRLFGRR